MSTFNNQQIKLTLYASNIFKRKHFFTENYAPEVSSGAEMSVLLLVLLNRMTVISIFFILYDQLIFNKFVSSLCYHSNGLAKTVALISFLSLVMLMSVLGNLLVMVAVCKDRQLRSETSHLRPLLSTYLSSQGKTSLFSISFVQLKSTDMTRV